MLITKNGNKTMNYKYLGKEQIWINKERLFSDMVHVFEEIHPNGYGHKEKYAFVSHDWSFNIELQIYRFNGEEYVPYDRIPFNILEDLTKHRDLFH